MNETILTNRQKSALSIISQSEGVSRENVQKILEKVEPVSRPTLIRDLNVLLDKKLIRVEGKASSTRYFSIEDNPLLRYFDLETYFKLDPDQRVGTKKLFDFGVLKHLKNIFPRLLPQLEFLSGNRARELYPGSEQPEVFRRQVKEYYLLTSSAVLPQAGPRLKEARVQPFGHRQSLH